MGSKKLLFFWNISPINLLASKAKTLHYEVFGLVVKVFLSDGLYGMMNLLVKFIRTPIILITGAIGSYSISPSNRLSYYVKKHGKYVYLLIAISPIMAIVTVKLFASEFSEITSVPVACFILLFLLFESFPFVTFGVNIRRDLKLFVKNRLIGLGIATLFAFTLGKEVNLLISSTLLLSYMLYSFNLIRRTQWD
jgi:hypothetical protein